METDDRAPNEAEKFGEILKKTRKDAGLTMWALARKIGCNINDIEHIERGLRPPRIDELDQFARLFGNQVTTNGNYKYEYTQS